MRTDLNGRRLAAGSRGMTLIEIMVVLTLLGIVMTVLAVNVMGRKDEAMVDAALLKMKNIETGLMAFELKYHRYPSTSEGLAALVSPPPLPGGRVPGAFLDNDSQFTDPWGNPFSYSNPSRDGSRKYELMSLGSDGAPGGQGTGADFSNWEG